MIDKPGIYLDVSEADYHADPCPEPSLSASVAKELLDRSPLHAWQIHPKLGARGRPATPAMDHGTLVHELLLGRGPGIVAVEARDWRTKVAKEAREKARELGKTPVLERQHRRALAAVRVIRERMSDLGIELAGESEVTAIWQEQTASGLIWARSRYDHLDGAIVYDLKTITIASKGACERQIITMGYDVQGAAYVRGLTKLRPDLDGWARFKLVFVETEPPYGVNVGGLDGVFREYGERRWAEACERWAAALRSGRWHGYESPQNFEAPGWLLARMEG